MAGVDQLEITETEIELKELLKKEKTGSGKERIQVLYLLKSGQAQTVTQASELVGRHRVTVQEWLRKYRQGGIEELRSRQTSPGRTRTIPLWAKNALAKRLEEPEGFDSYGAICQWLQMMSFSGKVRFFYQDETRIGLKTLSGRKITAKGVKPKGKAQWQFQAVYLYGVVEPATGEHFFFECTHLNSQGFQVFLELVSQNFLRASHRRITPTACLSRVLVAEHQVIF